MDEDDKLFKAVRSLGINVPILHYVELDDGGLRLYLYGGRMVEWFSRETLSELDGVKSKAERRKRGATSPQPSPSQVLERESKRVERKRKSNMKQLNRKAKK